MEPVAAAADTAGSDGKYIFHVSLSKGTEGPVEFELEFTITVTPWVDEDDQGDEGEEGDNEEGQGGEPDAPVVGTPYYTAFNELALPEYRSLSQQWMDGIRGIPSPPPPADYEVVVGSNITYAVNAEGEATAGCASLACGYKNLALRASGLREAGDTMRQHVR